MNKLIFTFAVIFLVAFTADFITVKARRGGASSDGITVHTPFQRTARRLRYDKSAPLPRGGEPNRKERALKVMNSGEEAPLLRDEEPSNRERSECQPFVGCGMTS